MKRKSLLLSLLLAMMSTTSIQVSAAQVPVELHVAFDDPTTDQGEPHRGPIAVPSVDIDDHALTFTSPCCGYTLQLLDEDGDVVYTTIITSDTLVLPPPSAATTSSASYPTAVAFISMAT